MASVAEAAKDMNAKSNALGEAAKKYQEARKRQNAAHKKTVEAHDKWVVAKPPSEALNEALRKAEARENAAIQDTNMAADALAAAAMGFAAAVAEFMAALALSAVH